MLLLGAALTLSTAYGLGLVLFRKLPLPAIVRAGLGASVFSGLIFLLLLVGQVSVPVFAGVGLLALASVGWLRPPKFEQPQTAPLNRVSRLVFFPILGIFGAFYLVHALAPEIQPDAISYHLGFAAEYFRLGRFPRRVGFYEILPQGLEMLFLAAYAIGRESAAKLVHFAFFLATLPLIVLTARQLKMADSAGWAAALLYFAAPVAGISGTSTYNDAALGYFTLATFYLLLLWRDRRSQAYLFAAGLAAGFCYAIKLTGLLVPVAALVFIVCHARRFRPLALLSAGAAVMIAPWMLRALLLTGDPVAPLMNSWFPNPYFNSFTELVLSRSLSTYDGFRWSRALWDWAISGRAQGVAGPLILLAPLALLAVRKPAGRLILAAALVFCMPLALNVGTRFLMPALPFLALALAAALPGPALLGCVLLQAAICFPPVIERLQKPQAWTLRGLPWRAALRLQPDSEYLNDVSGEYSVARFLEANTTPSDRIFGLRPLARAYTTRDVLEYWHTNQAQELGSALRDALVQAPANRVRAEWPPALLAGMRIVSVADLPEEWRIYEARLYSPGGFLYASPHWDLDAHPNRWASAWAFDGNQTTAWSSLTAQRRGMFLQARFDHPQISNGIVLSIAANYLKPQFIVEGQYAADGRWRLLSRAFTSSASSRDGLRYQATHALKIAGFTGILVDDGAQGMGMIGRDMTLAPLPWGVRDAAVLGATHLMQIP